MISAYPISKKIILCIDDDEGILRYLKALLERSGCAVLSAASVRQGLNLITMCNCDAVLLDYEMPEMDGGEVASKIKGIRPELIVILLSGSDIPTSALRYVDSFIPKFETSRLLLPMITELCSRAHAQSQLIGSRHKDQRTPRAGALPLPQNPI